MNIENFIREQLENKAFLPQISEQIKNHIVTSNYFHCFLYGKYLFFWKEFEPKTFDEENETISNLTFAYENWPENKKDTDAYADLNRFLLRFYFKYNKFDESQTYIINYFDTVGDENINESWPWRYRFKVFSEIESHFIFTKPLKYLQWIENAYLIEKERDETNFSIDVFKDFLIRSQYNEGFENLKKEVQNSSFSFICENNNLLESINYDFIPIDDQSKTTQLNELIASLECEIDKLNGLIDDKDCEIDRLNLEIKQIIGEKDESIQLINDRYQKKLLQVKNQVIELKEREKQLLDKENILEELADSANESPPLSREKELNNCVEINRIGVIGESKLKSSQIRGVIKNGLRDSNIGSPENKYIEIISSDYEKSKKTNLKKAIDNDKYDWLIIGAHPHKLNDFPENLETYIDKSQKERFCSTKYAQCLDSSGSLSAINKSNLKRALDNLIFQELSIK
jgi:hypothetical protein